MNSAEETSHIAEQLSSITGPEFARMNVSDITLSPADTRQVASILDLAQKNHLTVSAQGGRTKLGWGQGSKPDIYISLTRLNRIIEHPWQDLTCTVQAGCTWSSMQRALMLHGQFVALDPLFADHATVGGVLATNDSGALRHKYGSLRDLVIGMTLVLPDGTIAKTGGKVVKNVAGYDLCKLMTGSLGTLAIITEANFRLHPLAQHTRSFTIVAQQASSFASLLAAIRSSHLLLQAIQVRRSGTEAYLDVRLNAHPESHHDVILSQMTLGEGLVLEEVSEDVWQEREIVFAPDKTVLRIATLPEEVCAYADKLQLVRPGLEMKSVSQAIGLHEVALHGSHGDIEETIRQLRVDAAYSHTTVSVLQHNRDIEAAAFDIPAPVLSMMSAIKHQFDPDGILNPGRFFSEA
jgi:glycolate oxidase FAD binding subunit